MTDRLHALQRRIGELEQTADVLDRLLSAVPAGIVHVAADGRIVLANEQACTFLGLTKDEITDRVTADWQGATYLEDGSPCAVEQYPVSRCLMTGEPQPPMTIGVEQKDGEVRWAVFRAVPQQAGELPGAVVTMVDITERMAQEAERLRLQERLQLQDRLASVGSLAAGVAHEINNPLTYVLGNLYLAEQSGDPANRELVSALADAREGAERVSRIVRDLSRFSRVSDGNPTAFDLSSAIETAAAMARAEFRHRAQLTLDLEKGALAFGQADRLVQVFVNLLVNAAQSIDEGNATNHQVTVTSRSAGEQLTVTVQDSGQGMNADTLRRALDPFFTTKPVGSGSGLGLSISNELISAMGGSLSLESEPGLGTVASIRLPRAAKVAGAVDPAQPAAEPTRRLRILLVDDEPTILSMVRSMLRHHDVVLAGSGEEALIMAADASFDLILCDLMMPNVTGMDVYERLSAVRPDLIDRLVFMTGGAFTPRASAFIGRVPNRTLDKPFSVRTLSAFIAEFTDDGEQ